MAGTEVQDILELMTKKFELLNERVEEQNAVIEKLVEAHRDTLKELQARRELEDDLVAEMDRLTQRASTQLKVLIELTERWESQEHQ